VTEILHLRLCFMRVVAILLLLWPSSLVAQIAGDLHIPELHSRIFGNARKIRVLLPEGYDTPQNQNRRYPVLYMNDGQNLFDAATSLFNRMEWKVDETTRKLVDEHSIEPIIVVGIEHCRQAWPRNRVPPLSRRIRASA
jgi:predicted alpha/beta superfamily hydrolase